MAGFRKLVLGMAFGIGLMGAGTAQAVEIEYWQYVFDARIKAMDQLIKDFQAANPDITVKHTTFPYDAYQTKVTAAINAGQGPDVVQLYYGWLDNFIDAKLIQPLPKAGFPHAQIEKEFFPIVKAMKRGDEYWGLPTAVRSLALFYNKKIFQEAGLDPNKPPTTLDELVEFGKKTVQKDAAGNLTSLGIAADISGQDAHWWREVLTRQFGAVPYSADAKKVLYNDPQGAASLAWYTELQTKHEIAKAGFMVEAQAAFKGGKAAMTVDGTFRLGSFRQIKDFEWGVAELPSKDGKQGNYASYWANAIATGVKGEKLAASEKFLAYVTSPAAMKVWLATVGELPAKPELALTPENVADPIYGPFLKALAYSTSTVFVDELAQRQIAMDMVNRVLLQGQTPAASVAQAAKAEQQLIDDRQ